MNMSFNIYQTADLKYNFIPL